MYAKSVMQGLRRCKACSTLWLPARGDQSEYCDTCGQWEAQMEESTNKKEEKKNG